MLDRFLARARRPVAAAKRRQASGLHALLHVVLSWLAMGCLAPAAAQHSATDDLRSFLKLKIGGFTDFNFIETDEEGATSGFEEGQFVLHLTTNLGDKLDFFGEISFTATDEEFETEVERAHLTYQYSDALKISGGRFHTPINWWNTAFHHGQWLQTTADRPEMTKFGGVFIPVHFVGGLVEGRVPAGGMNLGYTFGLGNGRSADPSQGGDAGDVNDSRAWLLGFSIRPDSAYDLQVGGAYYNDQLSLEGVTGEISEEIISAYAVWLREQPEVIAEFAHVEHEEEATGRSYSGDAYYVQFAYRLSLSKSRFKPYLRWEDIDLEADDPVFAGFPALRKAIAGVRFDLYPSPVALKLEFRRQQEFEGDYVNIAQAQVSFAF